MATITTTEANHRQLAKQQKNDFALHVALIMKTHGVPKSRAAFIAWCEGHDGLNKRLGQDALPMTDDAK